MLNAAYRLPTDGLDGVTVARFQILAAEGRALALTEPHAWHLAELGRLQGDLITPTRHRFVDREPLWRVHQAVFAVLALESEPVDPRL